MPSVQDIRYILQDVEFQPDNYELAEEKQDLCLQLKKVLLTWSHKIKPVVEVKNTGLADLIDSQKKSFR